MKRENSETYIISFPKSGRTWLRLMIEHLGHNVNVGHAGSRARSLLIDKNFEIPDVIRQCKVIYLVREPRDTIVSFYYQCKFRIHKFDGTISEFIRDPHLGIHKILKFHQFWYDHILQLDDYLIVRYETLKNHTETELFNICNFLDIDTNVVDIESCVQKFSFEQMKKRELNDAYSSDKYGDALKLINKQDEKTHKVRKGKVGGYKDDLSDSDIEYIETKIQEIPTPFY